MIEKMRKQLYVAPRLEVMLFKVETVLGNNSIPLFGDDENGIFLGKENFIVFSDFPDDEYSWGDLWAEVENEEE